MIKKLKDIKSEIEKIQSSLNNISESIHSEMCDLKEELWLLSHRLGDVLDMLPELKSIADECPSDGQWILGVKKRINPSLDKYLALFDIDSYKTVRVKYSRDGYWIDFGEFGSIPKDKIHAFKDVYYIPLDFPHLIDPEKTETLIGQILEEDEPEDILKFRSEYEEVIRKVLKDRNES